jgi:hypothetical protein
MRLALFALFITFGKKPKQIDLLGDLGPLQAQGIYELEKDRLKLCWDRQFKTRGRPTRFANGKDGLRPPEKREASSQSKADANPCSELVRFSLPTAGTPRGDFRMLNWDRRPRRAAARTRPAWQ